VTEVGNDIRAPVGGSLITAREDLAMYRILFILTGLTPGLFTEYHCHPPAS
jgi:hypothetical protein